MTEKNAPREGAGEARVTGGDPGQIGEGNRNEGRVRWGRILLTAVLAVSLLGNVLLGAGYFREKRTAEAYEGTYSTGYFYFNSLTVEAFKEKVASGADFIVVVTRPDCANCRGMEPLFMKFAQEEGILDRIELVNVVMLRKDEAAWKEFKEIYGLEGTPTYIRYKDGKQLSRVGWRPNTPFGFEDVKDWIYQQSDYFAFGEKNSGTAGNES